MIDRPAPEGLDDASESARWCCNGNAEDCALCTDPNPPYPFLCSGHPRTAANERIVGEATEATELDKSRRYLRPVRSYEPDDTHWSVYQWLPAFDAWATGMSLCGGSMRQGPLPEGTVVACAECEGWRPKYERMLAPGYRPEDDDPEALRGKLARIKAEVAMLCNCCGDNRERMGRIRVELGLDTEGYFPEGDQ
jgi:hypothetical protein